MELTTNGTNLRVIDRAKPAEIKQLGPNQLEWCRQKWPYFDKNRVTRLRDAEAAKVA